MAFVGIWLAAVGVGDAVADFAGGVPHVTRAAVAWTTACATAVVLAGVAGFSLSGVILALIVSGLTHAAWLWMRASRDGSRTRAGVALGSAGAGLVAMFLLSPWWPTASGGLLERWVERSGFSSSISVEEVWLILGAVLFLQATANALVRLLLRVVGTRPMEEQELRGGRIIGPLERILIFGLAGAGQPTAAALVISAKGLLRFPEINKEDKSRIHLVTEYFLVGSLSSWILALAAAGLVALASGSG